MKFLEYLNRAGERRLARLHLRPYRPVDVRMFVGFSFLAGYYIMVLRFMDAIIPEQNIPLVRDAMLVLGPAVGLIVGAMFRTDVRDEQATANSGKFADAVKEQAIAAQGAAKAGGGDGLQSGDTVELNRAPGGDL